MDTRARLRPGTLVVLEGLDRAGKTTQAQALEAVLDPAATEHVRMPRGFTCFTDELYTMLESDRRRPTSGVARQLAHLACHAESVPHIREILTARAVLLDRWWWSTVSYGWASGEVKREGIREDAFMGLIHDIWGSLEASVIFVFEAAHQADPNNLASVRDGYRRLTDEFDAIAVRVPRDTPDRITGFILDELARRGLLTTSVE